MALLTIFITMWLSLFNLARTCAFDLFRSTRINVLYQQILFALQWIVFIRWFESILIEVFFTGNIYPATCTDMQMWDCVHWNRPPVFLLFSIGVIYRNNKCFCWWLYLSTGIQICQHYFWFYFEFISILIVLIFNFVYIYYILYKFQFICTRQEVSTLLKIGRPYVRIHWKIL